MDGALSLFAQDGATGLPTQTQESAPLTGADGQPGGGGQNQNPLGGTFMLVMLGALAFMIIFSMIGPRREKKRRQAMLDSIKKHDTVQTVGGVIGAIVELKPDFVVLKVDESSNTRIRFARASIQQVLTAAGESKSSKEEA